ncbi:YceD family protein [Xylanibacter muris]|uniref:DUF177 domain-containing protein n=1 Tax=Xylanibacter muris TaxID=2736290 RepID=A0ABX2APH6_9BACT|nr:DUF177 domain-containing protein [Xylanibacter muris]NPD93094.1 DUF177 domain-containing protein [Xylanibacter muris]
MFSLDDLKIDLKRLNDGETLFTYSLDSSFFAAIDAPDVRKGTVVVSLAIHKTAERYFELNFHIEGEVIVQCDRCLDDMTQAIESDNRLMAKYGEEYSEDDDLVTVAEDEGILDVAWFIYEFIDLSLPLKHVHAPGKCNVAMIKMLEEHSSTRSSDGDDKPVDPRWSGLEKLKNNI